jgi:hypothetical protein
MASEKLPDVLSSGTEGDQRQLCGEAAAVGRRAAVTPAREKTQHRADDRCDEPVAALIAGDHRYSLFLVEEAVRSGEVS